MVLRGVIRTAETLRGLLMSGRAVGYMKKSEKTETANCIQKCNCPVFFMWGGLKY